MSNSISKTDVRGEGWSSSALVTEQGITLPKITAKYLILSNWNILNDKSMALLANPNNVAPVELESEVYWGFRGVFAHQLFPGQTSELIPVNDLSQITLRSRPGKSTTVWYSWIL